MSVDAGAQPKPVVAKPKLQINSTFQQAAIARQRATLAPAEKLKIVQSFAGMSQSSTGSFDTPFKVAPQVPIARGSNGSIIANVSFGSPNSVITSAVFDATDYADLSPASTVWVKFKVAADRGYLLDCGVQGKTITFDGYSATANLQESTTTMAEGSYRASYFVPKQTAAGEMTVTIKGQGSSQSGSWAFFDCDLTPVK